MISAESFQTITDLDLEPIKVKLMHEASGEGWSLQKANAVEFEYRRFLYLMKTFPHEQTAPLWDVDIFWHYHILDTMKYAADCDAVFGYFLHHFPYLGLRGEDDEEAHHRVGERMKELYESTFGDSYLKAEAAYSGVPTGAAETAYSGVPTGVSATAYSGVPTGMAKTAYSGVPAAQAKTAYSGVPAVAYSGVPTAQAKTAYSGVPTAQAKTAYSGVPAAQAKTAYSGVPAAKTAYSGVPPGMSATAYSGVPSTPARQVADMYAERPRLATAN